MFGFQWKEICTPIFFLHTKKSGSFTNAIYKEKYRFVVFINEFSFILFKCKSKKKFGFDQYLLNESKSGPQMTLDDFITKNISEAMSFITKINIIFVCYIKHIILKLPYEVLLYMVGCFFPILTHSAVWVLVISALFVDLFHVWTY